MALPVPFVPKPDTAYMEVPQCRTCVHWDGRPSGPLSKDHAECRLARDGQHGVRALSDEENAIVETKADFGCVKWEAGQR
jgi:hypothetical protein